jgi:phosphoglycolate phosphatase
MKPFDLVMFDLDGTLVETAPEIMDAVNDVMRQFSLPEVTQKMVDDWIGHGTLELLVKALAQVTQSSAEAMRGSALLDQAVPVYNLAYKARCGTRSHLYPQVRETLVALRRQGVKLAVVTNKEGRYTQVVLDVHRLSDMFDVVISGDTFATKKPSPVGVAHCLERFGVVPERALFVGDSSIDVATARAAGVPVWMLPYGYNMGEPIAACAPDRIIQDLSSLLNQELLTQTE